MEIIEATPFTARLSGYLSEDHYRRFQAALIEDPQAGDVIPGSGGFRKIRWPDPRRGKGKRGGLRVIYYYFEEDEQLWLLTLYDKDEAADLSKEQRAALQKAIVLEKAARKARKERKLGKSRRR